MIDFDSLYRTYAADVFRFALYLCGNQTDAEDITAETFARALAAQESIQVETIKGYLFTIAKNLFLKGIRRASRHDRPSENLARVAASAHELVEQKEKLRAVLDAMQKLSAVDRAALIMRALDDLPYREIARVLEISETAAKVKVHRARASLMDLGRT